MGLRYDPKDASPCWPEKDDNGKVIDYPAVLKSVVAGKSKSSGADMETWLLEVYNDRGQSKEIKDYVTVPAGTYKIRQLAIALNRYDDFKKGMFQAEDYLNANLAVHLAIEEGTGGYEDKNKIKLYRPVPDASGVPGSVNPRRAPVAAGAPKAPVVDDDIPF